jgi:LPS sulfotransferase NodH
MLEGVDTGYETKFDFPERTGAPALIYTLASVPRTGSTLVSHLLWQTGCLGAPLEYLNYLPGSPYGHAHGAPLRQRKLWRSVIRRRTSPNGVFGVKCFSQQLREMQQANPRLLMEVIDTLLPRGAGAKVVRLKRRDEIAHAVSYARAAITGVWRKEQEGQEAREVAYSADVIDAAMRALESQERDWDALLQDQGAIQLPLWYEDVLADADSAVRNVADFLDVALEPSAAVRVPAIEQQSQRDAGEWHRLYSRGANQA